MTTRVAWILVGAGSVITACGYTLPTLDTSAACGNWVVDKGELCDDGNLIDGDKCDSNCTPTMCGNGIKTVGESCDDGNLQNDDNCTKECRVAICGDGIRKITEESTEACDDGNTINGDSCDSNCTVPGCGNGATDPTEVCDDGNVVNGDDCNSTCSLRGISTIFVGRFKEPGNLDGIGQAALVNSSNYMTLLGDKIYLASGQTVRVIDIATQEIRTIAGEANTAGYADATAGADARFRDLRGITTDGTNIWVSDRDNHVIRGISVMPPHHVWTAAGVQEVTGEPVTIVDGPPNEARFDAPRGLAYLNGIVYILEGNAGVLRAFDLNLGMVATVAGVAKMLGTQDGIGPDARFYGPRHVIVGGVNHLYISDTYGYKLRSYNVATTEVRTIAGSDACGYTEGYALASKLFSPRGLAFDGQNIYFAESSGHTIRQLQISSMTLDTLTGSRPSCAVDCSCGNNTPGDYVEGSPSQARWNFPHDIVYHPETHSLFVSDSSNSVIRRIR